MPKLQKINLSKGDAHDHPDFNTKDNFLVKIDGNWFAGKFSKTWFGWNFPWVSGSCGIQYDKPGYNSSSWQEVYKIQTRTSAQKRACIHCRGIGKEPGKEDYSKRPKCHLCLGTGYMKKEKYARG